MAEVAAKIAEQLASRGGHMLGGLRRQFKIMDNAGDKRLDRDDLKYGLTDFGVEIDADELTQFIEHADTQEADGKLTFDEFIVAIRGPMNEARQAVCDEAYNKFDVDGSGSVNIADIQAAYNTDHHPKVQSGEMTSDDVFAEFLGAFGDKDGDGAISQEEWYSYYNTISAGVDNDEEFELIIR